MVFNFGMLAEIVKKQKDKEERWIEKSTRKEVRTGEKKKIVNSHLPLGNFVCVCVWKHLEDVHDIVLFLPKTSLLSWIAVFSF